MKHYFKISFLLLILLSLFSVIAHAQNPDSLYAVFSGTRNVKDKIETANLISRAIFEMEYTDSSYAFTENDPLQKVEAYTADIMSLYAFYHNKYNDVLKYTSVSIPYFEQIKDSLALTDAIACRGQAYQYLGDFDQAVACSDRCLEIEYSLGDLKRQSSTLNDLSALYLMNHDYETAEHYIRKAIAIEETLDRPANMAVRLGKLSRIQLQQGLLAEALISIDRALELDSLGGKDDRIATRLSQKGDVLFAMRSYDEAALLCKEALKKFEAIGRPYSIAICLNQLGEIYSASGDKAASEKYYLRSVDVCSSMGDRLLLQMSPSL